jgi:hypothetical protein
LRWSACADQISVLSVRCRKSFIEPLAKTFPGHTVQLEFQRWASSPSRSPTAYPADMVVVTTEVLDS